MALALGIGPGVALELAPFRNFLQVTNHPLGLELELPAQPTVRSNAPDGELYERTRRKWLAVASVQRRGAGIPILCRAANRAAHYADCEPLRHQHEREDGSGKEASKVW